MYVTFWQMSTLGSFHCPNNKTAKSLQLTYSKKKLPPIDLQLILFADTPGHN